MADIFEVEMILADRVRKGEAEYKIRWKKFGPKGDSWEPEENLLDCTDLLKAYKAQKAASKAAPTPRRSQRTTKPTPRTATKPETKVVKSTTRSKVTTTSVAVQKQKKTALENDFITPKPPRASIRQRQRVLELEESAHRTLQEIRNRQSDDDEPDSIDVKTTPAATKRARNRLLELKRWLDQEKLAGGDEEDGASWWVVALCMLCFIAVLVMIVWYSPASSSDSV